MNKFRLLEVVSGLGLGGAERALLNRMKYCPMNFEQIVLNLRPEIDNCALNLNVENHRIRAKKISRLFSIMRFISRNKFDVIIVRTPLDAIRFGFFKYLKLARTRLLVFEAHSNFVSKRFGANMVLTLLLHLMSRHLDTIIAVSENVALGPLCKGHKNVRVVMLGAEPGKKEMPTADAKTARLIFIGRLIPLKRPIWLLERINQVNAEQSLPKGALTIVGSGPLQKELEEYITDNNLSDIVNFVGEQSDVNPYLLTATHLVSCSTNEGLPLTFFEAKLAGLAIISTPSGGGNEIFDIWDHELGTFDEKEFENALRAIFSNRPPTAKERKNIQAASSWMKAEVCAAKYYSILTDDLSK